MAVVWLVGVVVGCCCLVSVTSRYGCGPSDTGLACNDGGTVLGVLLVVTVVAVVVAVTVLSSTRSARSVLLVGITAVVALALAYAGAQSLLDSV